MKPKILVTVIVLLSLLLSAITIPGADGQVIREFKQVHINLKAEDLFSPEYEHRGDTEPQTLRINADYDQYPLSRTNRRWVDVGTWTSDTLDGDMTVQGTVVFNVWFQEIDEGYDNQPSWQFDLLLNDESIAHVETGTTASNPNQPIEVTAQAQLNEPSFTAISGDTFGMNIQYMGYEDSDLYFDNMDYDSGAAVEMDSIIIFNADKSSAKFYDAWGLNWELDGKFFCSIDYGGVVNMGDNDTVVEDGGNMDGDNGTTYRTNRIKFDNIEKGTGSVVTVTINYGPNETSEGWSMEAGSGGGGNGGGNGDNGDDDFPIAIVGGVAVVGALGAVGAFLFIQKRKAGTGEVEYEEEYEEDEYGDDEDEED